MKIFTEKQWIKAHKEREEEPRELSRLTWVALCDGAEVKNNLAHNMFHIHDDWTEDAPEGYIPPKFTVGELALNAQLIVAQNFGLEETEDE